MVTEGSRRLAAVWFADIVGFTRLSATDEDSAVRVLRELQRQARQQCDARGGRVVKLIGDAVLAVFDSADGAVRAALSLRDGFLASAEARAAGVSLRIGLHVGDVATAADGDVYGDAVNTASRVQPVAAPGQVLVTEIAYRLLQQRSAIRVEDLGKHELKGVPEPLRLYAAALVEEERQADLRELLQQALTPLQLLDVEGMGGMGEIYLARDAGLRRTLAVKVLRSELVADAEARARFFREARVIAGLTHPNVVAIHSVGELKDGRPYFVMDYVEGGSLEDRLAREGPLPVPEARRIVGEVASALEAAHARGVVHRDIKISNVLFDRAAGRALVTDWGIAALDDALEMAPEARLTRTGMVIGSPRYMSPEQLAGDQVGPESDVYSLGLLAFELLTGRGPFEDQTPRALMIAHLREDPPLLASLRPEVDPELESVVARCLAKDPLARPTAEEVARRFAPGAEEILEWPPPGLESLKGQGPIYLAVAAMVAGLLAIPVCLAVGARADWVGRSLLRELTFGRTGSSVVLVLVAVLPLLLLAFQMSANRFAGLIGTGLKGSTVTTGADTLKTGLALGYGWRTLLEVLDDRWGDYGNLVAGRREYAVLDARARARIRRRRVRRVVLSWAAVLALPFTLILAIPLVAASRVGPVAGLALGGGLSALLWALSLLPVEPRQVWLARFKLARPVRAPEVAGPQVGAWKEALAKVTGPEGPHPGRPTSLRTWWGYNVASVGVGVIPYAYFLSAVLAMLLGSIRGSSATPLAAPESFARVRAASDLRLPRDSSLTGAEAWGLARALGEPDQRVAAWNEARPRQESVAGSALLGGSLPPPFALSQRDVVRAALDGLSAAERAYLAGFAGDPRLPSFGRLARAGRYDAGLPEGYSDRMLFAERPASAVGGVREVALHALARAGSRIAAGDRAGAEASLREVYSVGLLLLEEGNDMIAAQVGRSLAALALDGLVQLFLASGRDTLALRIAGADMDGGAGGGAAERAPLRGRSFADVGLVAAGAADPSLPRALRLEMLASAYRSAECSSLDGILFGAPPEVENLAGRLRTELVRYPSDEAVLDMAVGGTRRIYERIARAGGEDLAEEFGEDVVWVVRPGRFLARVFRNPRFIACAVAPGGS